MSAEPKEPRLLLELVGDPRAPIELPRQGAMTLGSSRDKADVHLDGQGVADVHCAIGRAKGGGWALRDLGSEYGTIVNGERVQARKLETGDLVLVGSRRLRVIDAEVRGEARSAPARPEPEQAPKLSDTASRLPQVKGYRLERPLGRGGMGEVYLAVQESLGRPVALKVLAAKLAADADFVKRFQAEARAAAALNHPNVVTVHDVWEEGGRHFLAMEFMDRGNLEQRLQREGKLATKEAIEVLHDAAKALVFAELRGIVHRDIKPANLMQNSVGTTKVADLGLAMHLEAEATEADNKKIFGTPHFISPEQARGEKVDIRSDLYSLGATLYRMLSGRTPFEGATTRDILRGHFLEDPKPLAELVPEVPPALAAIVHRLLRKKPDERYASAAVLLQEVERLRSASLHGLPLGGVPGPAKSKTPLLVGGLLVVAGIVGALLLMRGGDGPQPVTPQPPRVPDEASTPDEPRVPDDTQPVATGDRNSTQRDDDTLLKLRETEAENALLKLASDLEPAARREELLALAERFNGTTAATRAAEEAEAIRSQLERSAAASSAYDQSAASWLERVRLAGSSEGTPKPLAEALRAMLAEELPASLAGDEAVLAKRKALFTGVVRDGLERARADLARADECERSGSFDELAALLRPWITRLDLPPMPAELGFEQIPELGDVVGLRGSLQKRLDGLSAARERYSKAIAEADLRALALGLRGSEGFEGALRALDLEGMRLRLSALEGALATEAEREFVRRMRVGVEAGQAVLRTLTAEFDKGGWRRKTLVDPRAKGRASRDAVGANAQGVLVKSDASSELVPWSAFGGKTAELHQLFHQRLSREYTREEALGIDALLRLTAVLQTVDETAEMLQPDANSQLSDEELRTVVEAFEVARPWASAAGTGALFEAEAAAAQVLVEGLRASTAGSWSKTVASLERLLREYRGTLLVRLLSDGRP